MATTKLYLDTRSLRKDGKGLLKIAISTKGNTRHISLGMYLLPECWDSKACTVIKLTERNNLNTFIVKRKQEIDEILLQLTRSGELRRMDATQLKITIECQSEISGFIG